jgi:catechol 2,3-dioxygenase-like lactoylglutathione lyase family enzyme
MKNSLQSLADSSQLRRREARQTWFEHSAILLIVSFLFAVGVSAQQEPGRPKIYGIAGVRLTVTHLEAATTFYGKILEADRPCLWCGDAPFRFNAVFYAYNDQHVLLDSIIPADPHRRDMSNLLEEVTFFTESVPLMRRYLESQGVVTSSAPKNVVETEVRAVDPEGHVVGFVERPSPAYKAKDDEPVMRIIHAGFVVHDSAVENHFYKDILGFRLYWSGGMKDGVTDWTDMQVPDGTDWIEYMLNVPDTASSRTRGVMNHFAVGVPDIEAAAYRVQKNGLTLSEKPKIGRDGKWQLNLYDPDGTRVEFMEFTPTGKTCCSEFTGPHPKP